MVHPNDINELQRMVTNLNEPERSSMVRLLNGFSAMRQEVAQLKRELETLKESKDEAAK